MVRPLDESQGSSPLQGHGSWLMCEVALTTIPFTGLDITDLKNDGHKGGPIGHLHLT